MDRSDLAAFTAAIKRLCDAFNREESDTLIDTYWFALEALPGEAVVQAIDTCVRNGGFFPTPRTVWDIATPKAPAPPPKRSEPLREPDGGWKTEAAALIAAGSPEVRGFTRNEIRAIAREIQKRHAAAFGASGVPRGFSTLGQALMTALPGSLRKDLPGEPLRQD